MSSKLPQEDSPLDAPPLAGNTGILVVDEDPAFQLGLKTFLREYVGFEKVFTARNGQEALDFIRAEPSIEVITLDYRMPGMTGIEVLQSLRDATLRPLSVLMITGYPSDELESEFHALGSDTLLTTHFVSKPVQFEKLEGIVLAAYDEVLALKRRALSKIETGVQLDDTNLPIAVLNGKIDLHSTRLGEIEHALAAQRGKWRSDFWKVALFLFAFWLAGQFGLIQKIEPHWTQLKKTIVESFTIHPLFNRTKGAATQPAEPGKELDAGAGQAL